MPFKFHGNFVQAEVGGLWLGHTFVAEATVGLYILLDCLTVNIEPSKFRGHNNVKDLFLAL